MCCKIETCCSKRNIVKRQSTFFLWGESGFSQLWVCRSRCDSLTQCDTLFLNSCAMLPSFVRFIWRHGNADLKGNWFPFVKTIFVKFSNSVVLTPEMNNPQLSTFTFPKVPLIGIFESSWACLEFSQSELIKKLIISLSFATWKSLIIMKS